MLKPLKILLTLLMFTALNSCEESEGVPAATNMDSYYPLAVEKYITYRLDSTVYVNLNTRKEVHTYIVQDKIDAIIKDNMGNDAYRIRRTIRSKTDTTQWFDNATFLVTQTRQRTELLDNNVRFIKLINPVKEFTTWFGNSLVNTVDQSLRFYENWEYFYEQVGIPYTVNNINFPETITINQIDEVDGNPASQNNAYTIKKSIEVYAKGVGLIYKDFLHEAWQVTPSPNFQSNSYGIRLTILNHNF
ncbi:MAG TPA: hypothetical protein VLA58_09520 [Chitinophagaceae bacterium]|nr:hypothetical protein [Chitinophagaceae bacterium]